MKTLFSRSLPAVGLLAALSSFGGTLITNGSFETTSNVTSAVASFSINLDGTLNGWTLSGTPSGNLILNCLVASGATTSLCGSHAFGGGMSFWVNPGASPDGGNYVGIDGDSNFRLALQQTIGGLTVGQNYTLTFWQAAAQQNGFTGATTEQWQVTFGSQTQTSALMNDANHGAVGWNQVTMNFTASSTSQTLSFLALGTPNGQPPFVLLDGVTLNQTTTPEPATFGFIGLGLVTIPLARKALNRKK